MSEQTPSNPPTAPGDPDRYPSVPSLERKLRAAEARIAELEAERDEARFQAEYYADGLESLADDLPEWQHQHADGETEDQSIIERAITTVVEWRSEKAKREKAEARVAELEAQKNGAYSERNKLVAALSKVFPAALSRHPDEDTTWDNDWRWIVFVDLPTGQASWHIHDSEKPLFGHLRHEQRVWDGHTTDQKYARLAALGKEADRG